MNNVLNTLLINPPSPFLEHARCEPPLGLMYLAGAARYYLNDRVRVQILDCGDLTDWKKVVLDCLYRERFDVVGVTVVTPQYPYAVEIVELVKQHTDALVVAGGPHITVLPHSVASDISVTGQGELPFVDVLQDAMNGRHLYGVVSDRTYPILPEPLWHPSRDLVELHAYSRVVGGVPATTSITSWGCPNRCAYCMHGTWRKFKLFSHEYVRDDLLDIHKRGIRGVLFVDDTFTYDWDRLRIICATLKELQMTWRCWTRVDRVSLDVLKMMKDSGCAEVSFGIESGSQKLLDSMHKGTTVEQNRQALLWAKEAGITTKAFLMVGIPGETRETIEETKQLIKSTNPDQFIVSVFTPIVGCDVWRRPEQYGLVGVDPSNYKNQWEVGVGARGGAYCSTDVLDSSELMNLHEELLRFIKSYKSS